MDYYQEGYDYADKIWNEQICKLNQATQDMAIRLMLMVELKKYMETNMLAAMGFAKGYGQYFSQVSNKGQ